MSRFLEVDSPARIGSLNKSLSFVEEDLEIDEPTPERIVGDVEVLEVEEEVRDPSGGTLAIAEQEEEGGSADARPGVESRSTRPRRMTKRPELFRPGSSGTRASKQTPPKSPIILSVPSTAGEQPSTEKGGPSVKDKKASTKRSSSAASTHQITWPSKTTAEGRRQAQLDIKEEFIQEMAHLEKENEALLADQFKPRKGRVIHRWAIPVSSFASAPSAVSFS